MKESPREIPLITLIGDPVENFYQLGLKDREYSSVLLNHMKSLMSSPWSAVNSVLNEGVNSLTKNFIKYKSPASDHLKAYCEGLERPLEEVAWALFLPEAMSMINKWMPGISCPPSLIGCSSYFSMNGQNEVIHGRILDFPLTSSFDKYERAILYKLKNTPQIFSYSTVGLPYPSLTAMTDNGLTVALHSKFTDAFCAKGQSIFEIIYELLNECDSRESVLKFIKSKKSFSSWGLNISLQTGEVISADFMGDETRFKETRLEPNQTIYFSNRLNDENITQPQFRPYGIEYYNSMREDQAKIKIAALAKTEVDDMTLLKSISTPLPQDLNNPSKWKLDTLTSSSVGVYTLNPKAGVSLSNLGDAPKYYNNLVQRFENIWDQPISKNIKTNSTVHSDYREGMRHFITAQKFFDCHDKHYCFHHIQLAYDLLENYPEQHIVKFYFLTFQFIFDTHKKIRYKMLTEFTDIKDLLPIYLREHCFLFINRLERILGNATTIAADDLTIKELRNIFYIEQKIPRLLIHKIITPFLTPRIEILDVIYGHAKG
jgi:hypothetical protein